MELSIIIPFYHGEKHILKLLKSIRTAADKSTRRYPVEVLVIIDSMATDENQLIRQMSFCEDEYLQLKISKNIENKGVAATRNEGITMARGRHLIFIDQDDMFAEDFFQVITTEYLCRADFILTNGILEYEGGISTKIYYLPPILSFKNLVLDDFVRSPGQVIVRKSMIEKCRFPEPLKYHGADDKFCWIWLFYLYPEIKAGYIAKPLYLASIHDQNYSHDQANLVKSTLDLWRVTLDKFPSLIRNRYVRRNIRLAEFRLGMATGMDRLLGGLEYLQYKIKVNKILRVLVRNYLQKTKTK